MKKIQAFTIFETLIVINLSAFLFFILFFIHRVVIEQSEETENSTLDSIFEIKKQLEICFEKSNFIYNSENDLIFVYPEDSLVYAFDKSIIKCNSFLKFKGEYQYLIKKSDETKYVDSLEIRFLITGKIIKMNLGKEYSPFFILNHKEQDFDY